MRSIDHFHNALVRQLALYIFTFSPHPHLTIALQEVG